MSDKKIRKLARFVFKFYPKEILDLTEIHVLNDNSRSPSKITGAMYYAPIIPREAYKLRSGVFCVKKSYLGTKIRDKTAYFIVIDIGTKRRYPNRHPYKYRAGVPTFKSFEEDFVHVLAHELHHNIQSSVGFEGSPQYEVEAEVEANKILAEFRSKQ